MARGVVKGGVIQPPGIVSTPVFPIGFPPAPDGGSGSFIISDTFTAADGTLLEAHTPDINGGGNPYTYTSSAYIWSNAVAASAATGAFIGAGIDVGQSPENFTLSGNFRRQAYGASGAFTRRGFGLRKTSSSWNSSGSGGYWVGYERSGSGDFLVVRAGNPNAATLASTNISGLVPPFNAPFEFELIVTAAGDTITGTIPSVGSVVYASATDRGNWFGPFMRGNPSINNPWCYDWGLSGSDPAPPPSNTLLTDLVHWWEMDEASGNRVDSQGTLDLSPNTAMSGRNVIGGDGVEITTSTYLEGSTNGVQIALDTIFTFALWVESDDWSSSSFPTILAVGRYSNSNAASQKCIFYEDGGNIRFGYYSGSSFESVGVSAPSAGTPFLLCGYYDQTAGEIGISVDGAAWTTAATTIGNINAANQGFGTITFGQWVTLFQYPFDGGVARGGYWDRVLSSAEVTALYNSGAGLKYAELSNG